jgi:hypothetical protein
VDKTDDTNGIGAPGEGWFFGSPHPAAARMLLGERSHRVGEGLEVQRVAAAVLEEDRRLPADLALEARVPLDDEARAGLAGAAAAGLRKGRRAIWARAAPRMVEAAPGCGPPAAGDGDDA